ncbi:Uncharacterised protein [uncultured archaeon]|nr:Uncharacterised protein [uncultured archaeon]
MTKSWSHELKILIFLLALILFSGPSLCQNTANEAGHNDSSHSQNSALMSSVTYDSSLYGQSTIEKAAEIQGIWSINLKGTEQVAMVLHQIGDNVFGSCKSEASGWNAVVMGSVSGARLEIVATAIENNSLTSTTYIGTFQNESFSGTFVKSDDLGNVDRGLFKAVLINRDLSGYSPAKSTKLAPPSTNVPVSASVPSDVSASSGQTQPKQLGNPKYVDVHSMSGYVPESLGVGFVGDGTVGAGGASMG